MLDRLLLEKPIEGWKVISGVAELSEKMCRKLASRRRDPLPVWVYGKRVIAWESAISEWRHRNTRPYSTAIALAEPTGSE